ncbi:N-acetylmuramoyl-L-alanine amidase [Salinicola tamaricis]|uniref:N-acetylmuramoyl-L-alanine amidase n=1 Tax=Salinicola tamaricis TaxID=1771309 RepID=UPI0030F4772F
MWSRASQSSGWRAGGVAAGRRAQARLARRPFSAWEDRTQLNDSSIGIEIVNRGPGDDTVTPHWAPYSEAQIKAVIALVGDIVRRYRLPPTAIVGHADIAPERKIDPGPAFPWPASPCRWHRCLAGCRQRRPLSTTFRALPADARTVAARARRLRLCAARQRCARYADPGGLARLPDALSTL